MSEKKVAIIGAGVIGLGWARVFSRSGWKTMVTDPVAEMEEKVTAEFPDGSVSFTVDLAAAVKDADFVQENAPERLEIKQKIFSDLATLAPKHAILASSSSSIVSSKFVEDNPAADRILIGHPFNPVDVMPLVEVVPHPGTDKDIIAQAVKVYKDLGQEPILIHKEIGGFVGNRLQVAFNSEAVYLVQQGVISVEDLDRLVKVSVGLRWATVGPFEGMQLGGGPEGAVHLFKGVGAGLDITLEHPNWTAEAMKPIIQEIDRVYGTGKKNWVKHSEERDKLATEILQLRKEG